MRRIFCVLAVYGLMLTQVIWPVSAAIAAARPFDPLSHIVICSSLANTENGSTNHHDPSDDHCLQCCLALSGFALAPPEFSVFPKTFVARDIAWQFSVAISNRSSFKGIPQARAPPVLTV
jgi:Protein of unknown function (DUF2946)